MNLVLIGLVVFGVVLSLILFRFAINTYKVCGANEILIKTGKLFNSTGEVAEVIHGGATFVIPFIQRYSKLSLIPFPINIDLKGALTKENIRVHLPSNFMLRISANKEHQRNAAMSLTGLEQNEIEANAKEIIIGQFRAVVANMDIGEINSDREKFLKLVEQHVNTELNSIGIEIVNVNIEDIKDEAGILQALGQKASSEARSKADIEVANAKKNGEIGVNEAEKEKQIEVTKRQTTREIEVNKLNVNQARELASAEASQAKDVATIKAQNAVLIASVEADRRKQVATLEAETLAQENLSKAKQLEAQTMLQEKQADATKRVQVANATANTEIIRSQTLVQQAQLEKDTILSQDIENKKALLQVENEARVLMARAKAKADAMMLERTAEADGLLLVKQAEAKGMEALLKAQADGYRDLFAAAGDNKNLVPTMEMIKLMPSMVQAQAEAISNVKFDKITVVDNGNGDATSGFLNGLVKSLPGLHAIAENAGVKMPNFLGSMTDEDKK